MATMEATKRGAAVQPDQDDLLPEFHTDLRAGKGNRVANPPGRGGRPVQARSAPGGVGTLGLELEGTNRGVGTLGLELEGSQRQGVGTLGLELEGSQNQGVGTLGLGLEGSQSQGVGTLGLELEGGRRGVGSLGLELEDSQKQGVGTLGLELEESAARRQEDDPFQVARGQLTFDAEGQEGGRFHSRRAHWPGGASGVTIGRGYDLGHHSRSQIINNFTEAGIAESDASLFAAAAGLTGRAARDWLAANRDSLPEVTPEQQEALFESTYAELAGDVERISGNYARIVGQREGRDQAELQIDWNTVHPAIRDVLVDLRYRGDYTPTTRQRVQQPAIDNDLRALYEVMRDEAYWIGERGVPQDRFNRRVGFLEAALGTGQQGGQQGGAAEGQQAAGPATQEQPAGETQQAPQPEQPAAQEEAQPAVSGTPTAFKVTASSLNVRSSPDASKSDNRVGSVRRGEQVTGTPAGNGWVQISFQGRQAYVSAQYLAEIEPGSEPAAEEPAQQPVGGGQLSGANWVQIANTSGWVNSTDFAALDSSWGPSAQAFVDGLRSAGATVRVTSGLRHPNRAFLMHFAWGVAHGQYTPAQANARCQAQGIDINWDHGNLAASKAAAQALVGAFGLVRQASITSNHIHGKAMDIKISNLPGSINMNGKTYTTQRGASNQSAAASVAPIGNDMGVKWFGSGDWVHWSHNGR